MARPEKVAVVDEVREELGDNPATLLTEYRGLSVGELADLRARLREVGARYVVVKNTLARIAAREAGYEDLERFLTGPTALTFCGEDPVGPAKALRDFSKDHPELVIKGGILEGRIVDADTADKLADLETREELLSKLAGMMYATLANTASLLQAPLSQLARVMAALEDKGELPPGEPAESAAASTDESALAETAAADEAETPEQGEVEAEAAEEPEAEAAEEPEAEAAEEPEAEAAEEPEAEAEEAPAAEAEEGGAVDTVRDAAAGAVETVAGAVSGAVKAAGDVADGALDAAAEVPENAGEVVGGRAEAAGDAAEDAIEATGEAVGAAAGAAGDAVEGAAEVVADAVRASDEPEADETSTEDPDASGSDEDAAEDERETS